MRGSSSPRMTRPRISSGRRRSSASRRSSVRGYTIRGRYGRINYVGVTNNPSRRAQEHRQAGKRGTLRMETRGLSRDSARRWERKRLSTYRHNHNGQNPAYNRTKDGGWHS